MSDTLKWRVRGELFEDGSRMSDWQKIAQSDWQWQYDTLELAFDIYEHDESIHRLIKAGLRSKTAQTSNRREG